jgi:hypothetical protein
MGLQLGGLNGRFERRDSGMSGYAMSSCRRPERTLRVLDAAMNGRQPLSPWRDALAVGVRDATAGRLDRCILVSSETASRRLV